MAVNETLKAVEDSAIRIADSNLGQTAITIVVWKLLYKEIAGVVIGIILLGISLFMLLTGRGKLSKNDEDAGGRRSCILYIFNDLAEEQSSIIASWYDSHKTSFWKGQV